MKKCVEGAEYPGNATKTSLFQYRGGHWNLSRYCLKCTLSLSLSSLIFSLYLFQSLFIYKIYKGQKIQASFRTNFFFQIFQFLITCFSLYIYLFPEEGLGKGKRENRILKSIYGHRFSPNNLLHNLFLYFFICLSCLLLSTLVMSFRQGKG